MSRTFVLDNGSCYLKAGYSTDADPLVAPNAVIKAKNERKRIFVGPELKECKDRTALYYMSPFEKGYLLNLSTENQVWDRIFSPQYFDVKYGDCKLVLTDPNYCVPAMKDTSAEVIFEDYCFHSALKLSSALCADFSVPQECSLIVDCGYSFTHIVPVYQGKMIQSGIKRMSLGGKHLTNQLKEWITYRQMHMMEETYIINEVKEQCCYVSIDVNADMKKLLMGKEARREIVRDYVLPDYVTLSSGYMRSYGDPVNPEHQNLQTLTLGNERFTIPELLFTPSHIGVPEMGIAEAVGVAIQSIPERYRGQMLKNIVIVGGSVQFPGFKERFEQELQSCVDTDYQEIHASIVDNPITHVWNGACEISKSEVWADSFITKAEFLEHGHSILHRRYFQFL